CEYTGSAWQYNPWVSMLASAAIDSNNFAQTVHLGCGSGAGPTCLGLTFNETTATTGLGTSGFIIRLQTADGSQLWPIEIDGGQKTGSIAIPTLKITDKWSTSGVIPGTLSIAVSETTSGTGSSYLNLYGGSMGTTLMYSFPKTGLPFFAGFAGGGATQPVCTDNTGQTFTGGTCAFGSGGSIVKVNSGSNLANVNINATTPAVDTGYQAATPKVDGSGNLILELPQVINTALTNEQANTNLRLQLSNMKQNGQGLAVMGYCCDSLSSRFGGNNNVPFDYWENLYLINQTNLFAGSGWVDLAGSQASLVGLAAAPLSTSAALSGTCGTNYSSIFTGQTLNNGPTCGGSFVASARAGYGPVMSDVNLLNGTTATITCGTMTQYPCTQLIAFLYTQSGTGGTYSWSVDSHSCGTGSTGTGISGAPIYLDSNSCSGLGNLTPGQHNLVVTATSNNVSISLADTINSPVDSSNTPVGIKLERVAMGGAQLCDFDQNTTNMVNQWARLGITTLNLLDSGNDAYRTTANFGCPLVNSASNYVVNLGDIVTAFKAVAPLADITVSTVPPTNVEGTSTCGVGGTSACPSQGPYAAGVKAYALANNVGYIGALELMGGINGWSSWCTNGVLGCTAVNPSPGYYDGVHWNENGAELYMD